MLPVAGTQAAIQALPRLRAPSRVVVSAPSYAEHAHHWGQHGHPLRQVPYAELDAAVDVSDVVVVVNPNNPTGETIAPERLLDWADTSGSARRLAGRRRSVWRHRRRRSAWRRTQRQPGLIVLRSIGKFFGLAGLRLGFVAAHDRLLRDLADLLGPWTISGPAQQIALAALTDSAWQHATRTSLCQSGERMTRLLLDHGIASSGTALFHWWPQMQPEDFHAHMAARGIWCRLFRDAGRGIRVGLPAGEPEWHRFEQALHEWNQR